MSIELRIVKYFNDFGRGKIDFFTETVSNISVIGAFWISAVALIFWFFPASREVLIGRVIIVTILHFSISELFFKHFLPCFVEFRKRPFLEYPDQIIPVGRQLSYGSMPSSHVSSTAAMLSVLVSVAPFLFWPALFLLALMSFIRLHNGMHYPLDILVGAALGFAYGIISVLIF